MDEHTPQSKYMEALLSGANIGMSLAMLIATISDGAKFMAILSAGWLVFWACRAVYEYSKESP